MNVKKKHDVLAVVVTYNRLELLKENINALKKIENMDFLVVDNHSSDETPNYLKKNNIWNIRLESNTGGAGGFYWGIKEAVKLQYSYVWLMDDDTIPYKETLNHLIDVANLLEGDFGFLCSYVEWIDGNPCVMNIAHIIPPMNKRDIEFCQRGILSCDKASFVSMLIPIKNIGVVGLPIKEFFIWGDDTEYSNRLATYKASYFVSQSHVLHKMKNNVPTDIITDDADRLDRYKYLYRNQTYMAKKGGKKSEIQHWAYMFYQLIKIMKSTSNRKIKKMKIVLSGWRAGMSFNPAIEYCDLE